MSDLALAQPSSVAIREKLWLSRASKIVVIGSAVVASLMTPLIVERLPFACGVLAAAFIAARVVRRWSRTVLLATMYIYPAAAVLMFGSFDAWRDALWKIAFLGVVLGGAPLSKWSLPRTWAVTLGTWALTIALCWPVVLVRELDFSPSLFWRGWYSIAIVGWVVSVAATQLIGLLWVDSLFAQDVDRPDSFRRDTIAPLMVSAVAAGVLAAVQLFWNVTFLNTRQFGFLRRASGGMLDANAYGVVAAMWACGALAIVMHRGVRRPYRISAGLAAVVSCVGCWASGSRTALLTLVAGLVWAALRGAWPLPSPSRLRHAWTAAIGLVLIVIVAFVRARSLVIGPVARILDMTMNRGPNPFPAILAELWNRNWYGTIANAMIRQFPLVGIGIGSFHSFAPRYADVLGHGPLPPDNAQNWFRHELAEFGLLGSIGWITWIGIFILALARRNSAGRDAGQAFATGALIGLGAASLLGMPTQNTATLLTFWTFVFWVVQGRMSEASADVRRPVWASWAFVASWSLALVSVAGTAYVGWQELRPPLRGLHLGFDYSYGYYEPAGETPDLRWAARHAVVVMPAPKPWIRVKFSARNRDIATRPVDVQVMRNTKLAMKARLSDASLVTIYLQVPDGDHRIMLETLASRPLQPEDVGASADRDLGLLVGWEFVDQPAADGVTVRAPRPGPA